ncbi:SHOCT domain-containing protein [Solidesulfovibrio alcoholivorans]|uniref:SHOCT domain-containing protein n=1 Tax=Solidesulfovibrio alcoholivorans TaxID=81406 RepID=UPI000693498F|nr:SHOCT domain-containing protein [Solidesulfovibrio alcoholivorans]
MRTTLANAVSLGGGSMLYGPLLLVILAVALIIVCIVIVLHRRDVQQRTKHSNSAKADREDALRLLRVRFASGSISQDEFERLRHAVANEQEECLLRPKG